MDTENIPKGVNNKFIQNISFAFDMLDYKTARLVLTDHNNENRFELPESVLPK